MTQSQDALGPTAPPTSETRPARPIPGWLAGVAAVAFLLLTGAFIYWFLGGTFTGTSDLIPDPARAERPQRGPGGWRQANADGVHAQPDNRGYLVRSGAAIMDVDAPPPDKKPTSYRFRYDSQGLLNREQWHLALGLRRIAADGQMARTLAVTPEQLERLRKFSSIPMDISKADREKVIAAFADYHKATAKAAPERALVAALKEAGARALPSTKKRADQRIAEIAKVLSPEQFREVTRLGAGDQITPITPAAPRPAP